MTCNSRRPLKAGSQCSVLIAHLSTRPITTLQAFQRYQICALSQRIGELKRRGHRIVSTMIRLRSGKTVASYRLCR